MIWDGVCPPSLVEAVFFIAAVEGEARRFLCSKDSRNKGRTALLDNKAGYYALSLPFFCFSVMKSTLW